MSCNGCPRPTPTPFADRVNPPTWTQATKQFFASTKRWIKSGLKVVTQQEHSRRMAICSRCNSKDGVMCTSCKCVIMVKSKSATEHCPRRRW